MRPIPSISRWSLGVRRYVLPGALVAILAACGDSTGPGDSALAAAEARWRLLQPASNSYVMRQQIHCFCGFANSEYLVTVTNGVVSAASPVVPPMNGFGTPPLTAFRTVAQLFAEVRNALGKPGVLQEVTYDDIAGFPTRLALDPIPNAVDDEVGYVTRGVGPQ
jgi:hypothetical protein